MPGIILAGAKDHGDGPRGFFVQNEIKVKL